MIALRLVQIYEKLRHVGVVRSKRDFARRWLKRGKTYLRDYEHKAGRDAMWVPLSTVHNLRSRIAATATRVSASIASDLDEVIREIDRDRRLADLLRR